METNNVLAIAVMTNLVSTSDSCHRTSQSASRMGRENNCVQKVDSDGTKWSVLEGRSDVAGEAFTYAAFIPADSMTSLACHRRQGRGCSSALKVSFGETLDLEHLKSYAVGSFLFVPANVKHTMARRKHYHYRNGRRPWHTHHPETNIITEMVSPATMQLGSSTRATFDSSHPAITPVPSAIRSYVIRTRSVTVSSLIAKYRPHKLCFKTYGLQWLDRTFPAGNGSVFDCVAASEQCWRTG